MIRPWLACNSIEDKCRSNLRQIALGLSLYANDFGGNYPDDFCEMPASEKLIATAFVCNGSNDTAAARPSDLLAGGHCSYIYLGAGLTEKTVKPTDVLAYEPPTNHGRGYNIVFGDGHVETLKAARGAKLVAAAEAAMKARIRSAPAKP
jgi:prepilin-type processing-associated H-X9-DG protein